MAIMELRMSVVGAGPVMVPPRPTSNETAIAREEASARPAPVAPPVVHAGWFDRNGDGRIDRTTWHEGGDAFLPVGKDIAPLLDRTVTEPVVSKPQSAPPPTPPVSGADAAPSEPLAPVTVPPVGTTSSAATSIPTDAQQQAAQFAYRNYGTA
jgi:hypothetical protein